MYIPTCVTRNHRWIFFDIQFEIFSYSENIYVFMYFNVAWSWCYSAHMSVLFSYNYPSERDRDLLAIRYFDTK